MSASTITAPKSTARPPVRAGPGGCGPHCAFVAATHSTGASALARHYAIDASALRDDVARAIVRLSLDAETQEFLDSCAARTCVDALASFLCVCAARARARRPTDIIN